MRSNVISKIYDPDNEYIFVENGSGVDFIGKRKAKSYE